jgi:hypothetical protein
MQAKGQTKVREAVRKKMGKAAPKTTDSSASLDPLAVVRVKKPRFEAGAS